MPDLTTPTPDATGRTLIHVHSRADALRDGTLIDASNLSCEIGFSVPVALTAAAWAEAVGMTPAVVPAGNDETGRLWDALFCLRCAIHSGDADRREVPFGVFVVRQRREPERVELRALIGPGDAGEPVITILVPGED